MAKIVVTRNGVKTEHEFEDRPGGFTCFIHDQGVRVDVPTFVEVGPKQTLACMEEIGQKEWEYISNGQLFQYLYKMAFDESHRSGPQEIPKTIEELNQGDFGNIHVAGMIVMGCEAMFAGKSVFFRNPETYLHPASERTIVGMFYEMLKLCGGRGGTVTATETDPEKLEKPLTKKEQKEKEESHLTDRQKKAKHAAEKAENPNGTDKEQTLRWLHAMDPAKPFAKVGDQTYTVADMILEVTGDSETGKQLIEKFVEKRG